MKITKIVLIITLLAFVSMSYADDKSELKITTRISLNKAIHNPDLVRAIYNQVNEESLFVSDHNGFYTAKVNYRRVTYVIYGTYEEWRSFFVMDPIILPLRVNYNGASAHP